MQVDFEGAELACEVTEVKRAACAGSAVASDGLPYLGPHTHAAMLPCRVDCPGSWMTYYLMFQFTFMVLGALYATWRVVLAISSILLFAVAALDRSLLAMLTVGDVTQLIAISWLQLQPMCRRIRWHEPSLNLRRCLHTYHAWCQSTAVVESCSCTSLRYSSCCQPLS